MLLKAQEGLGALAKKAHVGRESLYKALSGTGNPKWHTLVSLVISLGLGVNVNFRHVDRQLFLPVPTVQVEVRTASCCYDSWGCPDQANTTNRCNQPTTICCS